MNKKLHNIEQWQEVVDEILPKLRHNILLLKGNLGAGKTTFTKFLIKNLGSADEVSSPTYTLVNEYDSPKGKIFHFDFYRLKNAEEVLDIGIEEYLNHSFLCIIEWPEIYENQLPAGFHEMKIKNNGDFREVSFE
ncbi:MAG: tRNA (adenosine(37)-N6)-threonylcarbamoyltransferase complex ATPase subunit type 1 TsaE [Flavobacteriaceae bacterium]|nr:tRNA (adenosine(37)-N6)-threonylcarbamoyltransferase complex ATPase subunit type 1 TsaE [Flavobacteriaceae bacterium]